MLTSSIFGSRARGFLAGASLAVVGWLPLCASSATPPGTGIVNTARVTLQINGVTLATEASHGLTTSLQTPSRLGIERLLPPGVPGATPLSLPETHCRSAAGTFSPLPAAVANGQTMAPMAASSHMAALAIPGGQPIWLTLTDFDQNRDPLVRETVVVQMSSLKTGDNETVRLSETGVSTGVFAGYLPTTRAASLPGDCVLGTSVADELQGLYVDAYNGDSDTSRASMLVDPQGRVFDSRTGALVNGATVTLVNAESGAPAEVFSDDGVTRYPSTVVSGVNVIDSGGQVFTVPAGAYRFPLIAPGNYRLVVVPPTGYRMPSTVADSALQELVGAPWQINAGSRGAGFVVPPGFVTTIDVPLDPRTGQLELIKKASASKAAAGDFVSYTLSLRNTDTGPATQLVLHDVLPRGLRLQKDSVSVVLGGKAARVAASLSGDGRTMSVSVPDLAAGQLLDVHYVAEVTVATPMGVAINHAQATGAGAQSNASEARVTIVDELMSTHGVLVGRVTDNCDRTLAKGIAGIRVQMEDGRTNVSDASGRWHMERVSPGAHVVQIDMTSVPDGYKLHLCEANSRFVSGGMAQLIDLRPGSLWQADFVLIPASTTGASATASNVVAPVGVPRDASAGTVATGFDAVWLASQTAENAIEFPAPDAVPNTAAIGLAVRFAGGLKPQATINGQAVGALSYDGQLLREDRSVGVATWRALPLHEGRNLIEVKWISGDGQVVHEAKREVYYSSLPVNAEIVSSASRLVADGRQSIVLALRLTDGFNRPLRAGMRGAYRLEGQFTPAQVNRPEHRDALTDTPDGDALEYVLGADGTARIEFMPSTVSGPMTLRLPMAQGKVQELRTWVEAAQREWMVVGLVDGTVAGQRLRRDMKPLQDAPGMERIENGVRVALFAVGSVNRDTLLTIAYDTAKERTEAANTLAQTLRSNEHYLVYADSSNPTQAAVSSSKLYVRLDRPQFTAMFGDFTTDLGGGILTRFNRSLTGLRADYRGQPAQWAAFIAQTDTGFARDDLALDGTSGVYRLSRSDIVPGSDKLTIQRQSTALDRKVIEERSLRRFIDYRIDYTTGDVWVTTPMIAAGGERMVLVAEYETTQRGSGHGVGGVRVATDVIIVPDQKPATLGATVVRDLTPNTQGTLVGIDAKIPLSTNTSVQGEWAGSRGGASTTGQTAKGNAWLAEVTHQSDELTVSAQLRSADAGFGLGTQNSGASGVRSASLSMEKKITENLRLMASIQESETVSLEGASTEAAQAQLLAKGDIRADAVEGTWNAGVRQARETTQTAGARNSTLATAGAEMSSPGSPVAWRVQTDFALDGQGLTTAPERLLLAVDYAVQTDLTLTAQHQWLRSEDGRASLSQAGMKYSTDGLGNWQAGVGHGVASDGRQIPLVTFGMDQRYKLNDRWTVSGGFTQQRWMGVDSLLGEGSQGSQLPAGALDEYRSLALEALYTDAFWAVRTSAQWRRGNTLDKDQFGVNAYRELDDGIAVSAGAVWRELREPTQSAREIDSRVAWSRRPLHSPWAYLHRLDWVRTQRTDLTGSATTDKLLSSLHANRRWSDNSQVSLHHAIKWVNQGTVAGEYSGVTQFGSVEGRYSLNTKLDLGAHVFAAVSQRSRVRSHGWGLDIGGQIADAAWVSIGYNWAGLSDGIFNEAAYTAGGLYVRLRWHFDQKTLHLNNVAPEAAKR